MESTFTTDILSLKLSTKRRQVHSMQMKADYLSNCMMKVIITVTNYYARDYFIWFSIQIFTPNKKH